MKKILSIFLITICILAMFAGCTNKEQNKTTNTTTSTENNITENITEENTEKEEISFIQDLDNFNIENLKSKEETEFITYKTDNCTGTAYISFDTNDFYLRGCQEECNAIIFNKNDEPVAKICIEKDRYYSGDKNLEELDDFPSDKYHNWSHFKILEDSSIHIAEYVHTYGSLHISCKDEIILNQIVATINKNSWGGGSWSFNIN